jgi:hypothetical protein
MKLYESLPKSQISAEALMTILQEENMLQNVIL